MMNKDEGGIRSVAKALQILEAFDGEHRTLRVTDLARGLGLPKSTVHGLLRTLGARGFVRQVEGGRAYGPGPALLRLATMVDREVLLVEAARGPLRGLARGTGGGGGGSGRGWEGGGGGGGGGWGRGWGRGGGTRWGR